MVRMQAALAIIVPMATQSIACARANVASDVMTISATAVTAAVSANKIHSARWRSTATAADRKATAMTERYWPSAMILAPGSTLIVPAIGCPSAVSALRHIGW